MLRDAGVRTKLLAVLAIPTVLLVVVTALLVQGQVSAARQAGQVNALTDVAIQVNRVVHSLQEERSATLGYLQDASAGNRASMQGQRKFTNQQLRILRSLVATSGMDQMSASVREAVARSAAGHDELRGARRSIDAQRFFATETDVFYARIIHTDLDLPGVVASSASTDLAQRLQGYEALSSAIEYSAHERDLVEQALLRGSLTEADFATSAALVAQQRQALADVQRNVPAPAYLALDNALAGAENSQIDKVRRDLPDLIKGREPNFGRSVEWLGAANSRIGPMTEAETGLVSDIAQVAADTRNRQEQRSLLLVLAAVLGLGLALMLAVSLARRITRPLRRLTAAAGEIGDELPHMVERMQTPGEGPGVVVEPIPVESADEIGQLAVAFNTVNDVTVQVAKEQAALRGSIAEMFVNVARRNQVLLGRQLSQLDAMEAREEAPDVLDNLFKLDHLATRMRRNAESLLVLAGIDSTRRLRQGLPLSDVIRTAVGEIESFDRIDLSMSEDPEVSGRYALTVAHLLAELLENATHFSNPETRVILAAAVTGTGVDLTITDHGLGMSDDEIAEANAKIAHPPVAEIAVSQRLGLFVVGRLASRLSADVSLRRGRSTGTVVVVSLPTRVFEGMTQPEPESAEAAEAAPAPVDGAAAQPVSAEELDSHELEVAGPDLGDVVPDDIVAQTGTDTSELTSEPDDTSTTDSGLDEAPDEVIESSGRRRGLFRGRRRTPSGSVADVANESTSEPEDEHEIASEAAPAEVADGADIDEAADIAHVAEVADGADIDEAADIAHVAEVADGADIDEPHPPDHIIAVDEPESAVEAVLPEPVPPPFGYAPAVTILPSQHRPSRFGRRGSRSTPRRVVPVEPPRVVPAAEPTQVQAEAPSPVLPESAVPADLVDDLPTSATARTARADAPPEPAAAATPVVQRREPGPVPAGVPNSRVGTTPDDAVGATPRGGELNQAAAAAQMHSSALSELRGLYEPSFAARTAPAAGGLTRRTRKARRAETSEPAATEAPASTRTRDAAQVRGMLAGFRAGVERGRGAQEEHDNTHSDDPTDPTS